MDPDDMFTWIDEGYDRGVWYCPATGEIIDPYETDPYYDDDGWGEFSYYEYEW